MGQRGSWRGAAWLVALWCAACGTPTLEEPASTPLPDETRAPPSGEAEGDTDGDTEGKTKPQLATCPQQPAEASDLLPPEEVKARRDYDCVPLALEGRVVTPEGRGLAGARVQVGGTEARTDAEGRFLLEAVPRRNALLSVEAEGYRTHVEALGLRRPLSEARLSLAPRALSPRTPDTVRMLFGGDVSLGRRFLDVTGDSPRDRLPRDNPDALIRVSEPGPGSRAVFEHVRPYFAAAELRAVNLETPVTASPRTPHPTKDFAFFTLPGSLSALTWLGVDYAGLGNNHVYDYLEAGLADTLRHVDAAGLGHSGAGVGADEAFRPWRTQRGGTGYSFSALCSISGSEHEDFSYVASGSKGGAADLRDDARIARVLGQERDAGRVPVAVLHLGVEYSERPGDYAAERLRHVVDAGAALVIAHHPHTPQGLARYKGALIAQSLGNFAFDQDRVETMLGLLAEVELRGREVQRARLLPVYLEDYRPRPVAGELAERMLRRMSELSREGGVQLLPEGGVGAVLPAGASATVQERTLELPVQVGAGGWAVVDLRGVRREGESPAKATLVGAPAGVRLRAGRDVLEHGDFEDHDVDAEVDEVARWDLGAGAGYVCHTAPKRGTAALCQRRASTDRSETVAAFRNRVRVPGLAELRPNKSLTLVGWARGRGAGALRVRSESYASEGEAAFGGQEAWRHPGGTFDWTPFAADLRLPADPPRADAFNAPWALRLFVHAAPPATGEGTASVDDLAVVAWEQRVEGATLKQETPHARDFLRVEAAPGSYTVRVTLREHRR